MSVLAVPRLAATLHTNLGYLALSQALSDGKFSSLYTLDKQAPPEDKKAMIDRAALHFIQALVFNPEQITARRGLAQAYILLGETRLGIETWMPILQNDQLRDDLDALALGLTYLREGQLEVARQIWNQYGSETYEYFIQTGDHLMKDGDYELALRWYELAQFFHSSDELDMRIILVNMRKGKEQEARWKLSRLLQKIGVDLFINKASRLYSAIDPAFIWLFIAAADEFQTIQDSEKAQRILVSAYHIQPDPITLWALGSFYCSQGRFHEGISVLNRSKAYGVQYYALASRQRLSLCYCRAGHPAQALQEAKDLAELAPAGDLYAEFRAWPVMLNQQWASICQIP